METAWNKLPIKLLNPVKLAIEHFGFKSMTPVQAACIPQILGNVDVAAEAITGSGKTLAFLIPVIQILLKREASLKIHDIGALIISPTRELARQTYEVLQVFLKYSPHLTSLLFVGGTVINRDLIQYSKTGGHIIVCTPGRMCDLLNRKVTNGPYLSAGLKSLDILILDEADRLLECGFTSSLNIILAFLPKQRRTSLFSATQTTEVNNLIRAGLRNARKIRVQENPSTVSRTPLLLSNFYLEITADKKMGTLISFLERNVNKKLLIFFSTCACVEYFTVVIDKLLTEMPTMSIHGKMKGKRFKIFDEFRKLNRGVLLCTDVMCRGVDIPEVDWVIQYDPPSAAVSFVHRCGRTARSGLVGSALVYLLPNEIDYVTFIKLNQEVTLHKHPSETSSNNTDCLQLMKQLQLKDRTIMDKANRAFVSYIQAYKKHECYLILNLKELNFGHLAVGYGLLKWPKMPELKNYTSDEFVPYDIDFNTIKYANPAKENARKLKLKKFEETGKWPGLKMKPSKTVAWSKSKEQKAHKKLDKANRRKRRDALTIEELEEVNNEYHLIKKIKANDAETVLGKYNQDNT